MKITHGPSPAPTKMCSEALLAFYEQRALSRQDEERFLLRLGVVQAVRLARFQDMESDPELRELGLRAFEGALGACRALLAVLRGQPLGVPHVHDEPAVGGGGEA
jgi:hypothetical protein